MNLKSYEEPLMQYGAFRLHKHLLLYVPPVLLLLGTVGNTLSVVILTRKAMRRQPTYFYLAVLSVADTVVLYLGLLRLWLGELTGEDVRDRNDVACQTISVLAYTASDYSGWLIIAVTVERWLAVCHPLRASAFSNRNNAIKVVTLLLVVLFLVNCHFFVTVQIVYIKHADELFAHCEGAEAFHTLIDDVWPWVDAFIYSFLPFVSILVFNSQIIRQVLRARRTRYALQSGLYLRQFSSATTTTTTTTNATTTAAAASNGNANGACVATCSGSTVTAGKSAGSPLASASFPCTDSGKITIMLLTISFAFLVTTVPMNIALIATRFLAPRVRDIRVMIIYRLTRTITELLMYLNHSINFFLYCATGQKFRDQFIRLVTRRKAPSYPGDYYSGGMSNALQVNLITPNDVRPELVPLQECSGI